MKVLAKLFQPQKRGRSLEAALFVIVCFIMLISFASNLNAASMTHGAKRFILDNGFTVILKEDHSAPVAAIQVWVKTGSANETEDEAGITHLIEHMIFKGTPSRKTGEIARTIEASGGHINAYTSFDRTVYYVEISSDHFETGIEVLLDAVQHSLFDSEELALEKEVVLEEYRRSLDVPERRLSWAMMDLSYTKHPYKRPIIGFEETIRSFDRQAVLAYMDKWYTPKNMVLVGVGDFDTQKALKAIKHLIGDFPERSGKTPSRQAEPAQTALRMFVKSDKVQQVYLNMLWHIPSLTHEDIYPLDILEVILGHGKSSRLYSRLKMKANLVYGVGAGTYALADPGLFAINASLSPEKLDSALKAIGREISRITEQPVAESELARAKTVAEANFVFEMEDMAGQARTLAFFQTMTGDMYNADNYLESIKEVTPDQITRVVRAYLRPENLSIGILAPEGRKTALDKGEVAALFSRDPHPLSLKADEDLRTKEGAEMIVMPNGMRLIIKENHRLPEVSFTGVFLGGTRLERDKEWGISKFVADMLTRGTRKRSESEIASTVESWAGQLQGFSGRNSLGISGKFLSKDLYAGLELLADVALNADFPEPETEKVREDMLAAIKAKKDRPTAQLFDLFYETLYRNYPYGHPRTGTSETIRSITRAGLKKWYGSLAMPSNFVLAIVGDVNKDQLIPYIKTLFATFPPHGKKLPRIKPEPPLTGPRKAHIERPGAQTHVVVGYLGADLKSKDNPAMALVKTALSGQGGRLFFRLRDKKALAYSITAFRNPGIETGAFCVYLACDPEKTAAAEEAIFQELRGLREKGLTQKELDEARSYLLGNLKIGLQTNGSRAMQMALDELYGLGHSHIDRYTEEIKEVSLEDTKRAVQRIIVPERYVLVTVGPN